MRYLFLILPFFCCNFIVDGQFSIHGVVSNEKAEKLSFATVFIENSPYAASTDEKGHFIIRNIPPGNYRVKATFIGYQAYISQILVDGDIFLNIQLKGEIYNLDQIEIQANRVGDSGPFTHQNMQKKLLQKENLGQDVPFLLQWTPSMVVTSDGGTGIGYTGLRLRGSDQTRINVTINGVPLNDAESQNVFWVDLPDLMGSVNNIQIQRGVGTSTNGSGAFGGTVSINTADTRVNPYIDLAGTMGAFNTRKLSVSLGTGLINDRYLIDGRYSIIKSDGYVDRASADLHSIAFSAARITGRSSLRLNILSGKEKTYQAWYGVPEAKVKGDDIGLLNHYYNNLGSIYKSSADSINLFSSDRRFNYYTHPGQVDDYRQTHAQLLHSLSLHKNLKTKLTMYYTKGKGFFEEFKYNEKLANYNIASFNDSIGNIIDRTDIVRRRWLDNDLVGILADAEYSLSEKIQIQSGLSGSHYSGSHFGTVLKSTPSIPNLDKQKKYYDNMGKKSDIAAYLRGIFKSGKLWTWHADLQLRKVNYEVNGIDNDLRDIDVAYNALFFNPKIGVNVDIRQNQNIYLSFAMASKEPSRGDFIDNAFNILPKAEKLKNLEMGFRTKSKRYNFETNFYYMLYKDQLVLTGELNDVGAAVRLNVTDSYRLGWEASTTHQLNSWLAANINLTLSKNKIKRFDEVIADYTTDFEKVIIQHTNADISFSPSVTGTFQLLVKPLKTLEAELSTKYVSRQFMDNTKNLSRSLPSYHYQNLRISWQPVTEFTKNITLTLMVNNLLNVKYSSNGYTYSYVYGDLITENFLYPQAGRHLMVGVNVGF